MSSPRAPRAPRLLLCLALGAALLATPPVALAREDPLQANKDLVRKFYRAMLTNDQETLPRLFAQGYQVEEVGAPPEANGLPRAQISPDFRVRAGHLHKAFTNLSLSISDLIAEGDQVVARVTVTGVHRGEFMGVVATGRRVSLNAMVIFQIKDGRITRTSELLDMLGAMRQVGYIKLD
ncbi:MAG: ester cyclase [Pseudomonadota bacterium]